jgi:hypothetical protein
MGGMTEHEPAAVRARTIGSVYPSDDVTIMVEHVYAPGTAPCGGCGQHAHDPGVVGMITSRGGHEPFGVSLAAEDALLLANRLTRAANIVLELGEDAPDIEREAARFAPAGEGGQ